MIREYLSLAIRGILHRRKRSWLTIIGILIGITAVVALISLGQSMQLAVNRQFEEFGYNVITIMPGTLRGFHPSLTATLELDAAELEAVEGVESAGMMFYKSSYIQTEKLEGFLPVMGLSPEMVKIMLLQPASGRLFRPDEPDGALLGPAVAQDLELEVGDTFKIEDRPFKVVGVLKKGGNPRNDEGIFVPLQALWEVTGEEGKISIAMVRVEQGYDVDEVADRIKRVLLARRGKEDFTVQTVEQLRKVVNQAIGILGAFLGGIAGISLLVGGIGVMNTMYTAVLERTREIGVMKAVGAKDRQIMWLFLIESGLMGLAGGAIGTLLGVGLNVAAVMAAKRFIEARVLELGISPWLVLGALAFSFVVGALSGLFPARSAAKLPPVEALRYE